MLRIALLLTAVVALASAFVGSSSAAPARLTATVGPGYTITLKKGSSTVRTLKRGTYLVTVRDRSSDHDFHLRGPVSRMLSSVGWTGTFSSRGAVYEPWFLNCSRRQLTCVFTRRNHAIPMDGSMP